MGPQSVTRSGEPGAKPRPTAYQRRLRTVTQLHRRRHLVQLAVVVLIVAMAVRHGLETEVGAPSVDALCPFGAVETFWTWVTTGSFISKIHASNLVVGLGLLLRDRCCRSRRRACRRPSARRGGRGRAIWR